MRVHIDSKFKEYFKEMQQIFLYVTDNCDSACHQCLYKPWLRKGYEFKLETAKCLLVEFKKMGAIKLSILGGEPTKYKHLSALIKDAKKIGYEYIRLDTDGQFKSQLLFQDGFRKLDELTFSIDGDTPSINDSIRGRGAFRRAVSNIKEAVQLGYNVEITCCVHRGNIGRNEDGSYFLERMIDFASSIGVRKINFHPLFKMGIPRDEWAGETDISPETWRELYSTIRQNIDNGKYTIPVRIPQRFISYKEFDENPALYGYCPVKMGERILIHANGQIQICALMIGTTYSIARFEEDDDEIRVLWEANEVSNELKHGRFDLTQPTPCTHQIRNFGELVPLCISFKPMQEELIWKKLGHKWILQFKNKRK